MKQILPFICALFFLQVATAQFCPGNIITNGDLELGSPTAADEDIALAQGWGAIWESDGSVSTGDFYAASVGTLQPTPQSGNYASFWVSHNPLITYREGVMNQLAQTILPNTGTYALSFDFACTFASGTGSPELSIHGVHNPSGDLAEAPSGNFSPSNADLFGAINTFHIEDIPINQASCDGVKSVLTVLINSSDSGFPVNGLTHIFFTHSDNADINARCYSGIDNLCMTTGNCGDIVGENIECVYGGYQYTFEVFNTSGKDVNSIDISIPGVGYNSSVDIPNGSTHFVSIFIPEDQETALCFDVTMYADTDEVCSLDNCIDIPLCNPCEELSLQAQELNGDPDECCFAIDVTNDFYPMYYTHITTTVITPNVSFDNPTPGPGWTVSGGGSFLKWSPQAPFIDQTDHLDAINFCFNSIKETNQMPQVVVFDWMTPDVNGQDSIACTDTLVFNCEPCMMITHREIKCLENGTYEYCFTLNNNGLHPATELLLNAYTPPGVVFTPNPIQVGLAPGTSDTYCVNISGVNDGDIVEYNGSLSHPGIPPSDCSVDTFRVEMPECEDCKCDEKFEERAGQGFQVLFSSSCQASFSPVDLDDCYKVRWTVNGQTITQTTGNEVFYYNVPGYTIKVCMHVYIPGTECSYTFCKKLKCYLYDDGGQDGPYHYKLQLEDDTNSSITIKNLYPNPVSDLLNVKLAQSLSSERLNIQIINLVGEVVLTQNNQSVAGDEIQINVERLSEGIYFLKLEGDNNQSDYLKFVKLR